ncbi:STAS domain-containing protein, partial [Streptomyces sp. NPDC059956]
MSSHSSRPRAPTSQSDGTLRPPVVIVVLEPGPHRILARVRGEVDSDSAGDLREDLTLALASSHDGLDVDLSAVTFC